MDNRKDVLERRLQHEGLRSVIPNVEDCRLRIVYEQKDRLFEWIVFEKEHRNYGCLIEHQANQMNILSDQASIERCRSHERDVQALIEIADIFFNPERNRKWQQQHTYKKNKRFEAIQIYLEVFAFLKDAEEVLATIQLDRKEAEFVVNLFDRLREIYEKEKKQSPLFLWRKNEPFHKNDWIPLLKDLHSAFIIIRKLTKLPFREAHKLGATKVRMMTAIGWRRLHWHVYTYWHDEYFYLFNRWKSNPDNFEDMEQMLRNRTNLSVSPLFPKDIIVSNSTLSCEDESFRFLKEEDL